MPAKTTNVANNSKLVEIFGSTDVVGGVVVVVGFVVVVVSGVYPELV